MKKATLFYMFVRPSHVWLNWGQLASPICFYTQYVLTAHALQPQEELPCTLVREQEQKR